MKFSSSPPSLLVLVGILLWSAIGSTLIQAQETEIQVVISDATPSINNDDFLAFANQQELKSAVDLYLDYHFNPKEHQRVGVDTLYLEQLDVYGDIAGWKVHDVDNFANLFSHQRNPLAANATNLDLSRWDVSNAQYLQDMFLGASKIDFDVSTWDTSKAQHFNGMFEKATRFEGWGLERWNVSQGQLFASMFSSATALHPDLDLSSWQLTSATDLENMFRDSSYGGSLTVDYDVDVGMCAWVKHLDPSAKVTNMFKNSECVSTDDPVLTDDLKETTFCGPCNRWVETAMEEENPAENDDGDGMLLVEPPQINLPDLTQSQFHHSSSSRKPNTLFLMDGKPSSGSQQYYVRRGSGFKAKFAAMGASRVEGADEDNGQRKG
jgi:hypothetical protein